MTWSGGLGVYPCQGCLGGLTGASTGMVQRSWGMPFWGHLGETGGMNVSWLELRCVWLGGSSTHCAETALGRWLDVVWAKGTEHTGEALRSWLARAPGPCSRHAI